MVELHTSRLVIESSDKDSWLIRDKSDSDILGKLFFHDQWFNLKLNDQSLGLGVAAESTYALLRVLNHPSYQAQAKSPQAKHFLTQLGFVANDSYFQLQSNDLLLPDIYQQLNQQLGIDTQSLKTTQHLTSCQLVASDIDCFNRPTRLNPHANQAWQAMKSAAKKEGVNLQLASAFRSMRYQAGLIQRKMGRGESIDQILNTNTAPGHSEHHTGRAIDITTEQFKPLEEAFENSPAFAWLTSNAAQFGFTMSYPKDNDQGIIYEPWHWCYHQQT